MGILDSKDFAGLHPGYFVVFSGVYDSNAAAATHISQAETAGFTSPLHATGYSLRCSARQNG